MNPKPFYHLIDKDFDEEEVYGHREDIIEFLQKNYTVNKNNWREVIQKHDNLIFKDYPWYVKDGEEEILIVRSNGSSARKLQVAGMPRHDKKTLEHLRTKTSWDLNEIRDLEGW